MTALTMNDNVFVLLEDPLAPTRADVLPENIKSPSHYRTTFLTLRPPGALEVLMTQLKARWTAVRQSVVGNAQQRGQSAAAGQQLTIDGHVFGIGNDWLVRVGNVILAGGAVKGMLLEVCSPFHSIAQSSVV